MAQPSIQPGGARQDLNPVAMLQASGSATPDADTGFEAALDRARQPETTPEPASGRESGRKDGEREVRSADQPERREVRPDNPQRPAGERSEKSPAAPEATAHDAQASAPAERAVAGKPGEEETNTAAPAALPADIAAILAAFLAGRGAALASEGEGEGEDESALLPQLRGNKLALGIADVLGGESDKAGKDAAGRLAALLGARDGQHPIALDARDKGSIQANAAQALAAAQTVGGRGSGGAEALLAVSARSEANPAGVQTTAMPFAARLDGAQALHNSVTQLPVATTVGHRGWAAEVGNQVSWMLGRGENRAELLLTPPSLGKLGVSIQVNGDQTTAHFVAATQATRDALEQAMPRLREVLQQAGINLGQTSVGTSGEQAAQDGNGDSRRGFGSGTRGDDGDALPLGERPAQWTRAGNGVIDTFA